MEQWSKAKEMFRTPKAHQENKGGKTIVTHFHTDGLWWYYSRHGVLVCKIYSIEDKGISGRLDMQNMRLTDSFSFLFSNTVAAFSGHRPVVPADVVVDGRNQKEWRVTDGIFVAVHRTANWKRGQSRKKKKMDKTVEKYVNKTSSILQCSANRWWRKIQISFTSSSTQTLDKKKMRRENNLNTVCSWREHCLCEHYMLFLSLLLYVLWNSFAILPESSHLVELPTNGPLQHKHIP